MNNRFDTGRFGKYYLHDLKGIWKNNGILIMVFAIIPAIFYLLYMTFGTLFGGSLRDLFDGTFEMNGPSLLVRVGIGVFTAEIFAMIFPSRSYGFITEKGRGSSWLMLPASRGEKYSSMMLNCLIVIPSIFLIAYLATDSLVCLFDRSCGMSLIQAIFSDQSIWNPDREVILCGNGIWILLTSILSTAATYTLGAVLFRKWKVLGTILWLWILECAFFAVIGLCVNVGDFDDLFGKIETFVTPHLPYIDIWLNVISNILILGWLAVCGLWTWARIKKLQH